MRGSSEQVGGSPSSDRGEEDLPDQENSRRSRAQHHHSPNIEVNHRISFTENKTFFVEFAFLISGYHLLIELNLFSFLAYNLEWSRFCLYINLLGAVLRQQRQFQGEGVLC